MASSSYHSDGANLYSARGICQIVGLTCLAGFALDMLILGLPPSLGNPQWRVSFIQQMSDRSIVLLIGAALTIFGNLDSRRWLKRASMFCLVAGIAFLLSCILVIADGLSLRQQAVNTISTQESQIQTRIRDAQSNPKAVGENVSVEDLKRLSQQLTDQANTLKQSAQTSVIKTGAASVSNLVVIGLGLIGLGRYGMSLRKSRAL